MGQLKSSAKPFEISNWEIKEAWEEVRANRGAPGVDGQSLMRRVEPVFHPDSYGYRPGRSALDAVGKCRERCWKRDWVVEFDIAQFFDSVPWDLPVKAVEAHADAVWVKLYVQRWLEAPLATPDGTMLKRECGTPQGAPVSPVLANLFLHYEHLVRTLCGRRGAALRHRASGPSAAGRAHGEDGRGRAASAPGQDSAG
ncbi:reverse transcriptase domain-containing protein [Streptomyces sp. NPDC006510]|uniref:reverse transcriptase domain-containing protein n=1 Tax=Streptomyces sp. NPDC006510 TaxID=3155600 RepID=UPI0033BBEE01